MVFHKVLMNFDYLYANFGDDFCLWNESINHNLLNIYSNFVSQLPSIYTIYVIVFFNN